MKVIHSLHLTALLCLGLCWSAHGQVAPKAAAPSKPPGPPVVVREDGRLKIPVNPSSATAPAVLECVATVGPATPVTAVALSPDAKLLVAAGQKNVVAWDLEEGKLLKRIGAGQFSGSVHSLAISKDGKTLAVGEGVPYTSGAVKLFELDSGKQIAAFQEPKDVIYALAFCPEGKLLSAGSADGKAYVWSLPEGKLATTIQEHGDWVTGVAFSPDGKLLATGSADRSARVWEVGTWQSLSKFLQADPVQAVGFSPDGQLLAWAVAGPVNRMVRMRLPVDPPEEKDAAAAAKKPRVIPQVRNVDTANGLPLDLVWGSVEVSKQQQPRLYVACADRTVKVYNATGGLLANLTGHGDWVYCVAVSGDGTKFASGSADGTVRLFNAADNRPLATLVQLSAEKEDWLVLTSLGYFATSKAAAIGWNKMSLTVEPEKLAELLGKSDSVRDWLGGKKVVPPTLK